jgi:hypothetical protein
MVSIAISFSLPVAISSAGLRSSQGRRPLAVAGLDEPAGVPVGDHDVGMVHEPVDRGGVCGSRRPNPPG